jgi:hypothetical protein
MGAQYLIIYLILFFFVFCIASPCLVALETSSSADELAYEQAREELYFVLRRLKKNSRKLAGPEVDKLYRFVRDGIAYELYEGVLRLAQETLMSMAGNACNQSLLLENMLRTHKIKVKYALGRLSNEQVRKRMGAGAD